MASHDVAHLPAHGGDRGAMAVERAVPIAPPPVDGHVGLVTIPRGAGCTTALGAQMVSKEWGEALVPVPDRFMGKGEAARHISARLRLTCSGGAIHRPRTACRVRC